MMRSTSFCPRITFGNPFRSTGEHMVSTTNRPPSRRSARVLLKNALLSSRSVMQCRQWPSTARSKPPGLPTEGPERSALLKRMSRPFDCALAMEMAVLLTSTPRPPNPLLQTYLSMGAVPQPSSIALPPFGAQGCASTSARNFLVSPSISLDLFGGLAQFLSAQDRSPFLLILLYATSCPS